MTWFDKLTMTWFGKLTMTYESIRARAKRIKIGDHFCLVADLEDIIKSKKATGREKDIAVNKLLEDTLKVKRNLKR